MRIILIRHGQSTGNTERRFQGQSKDPRFHLTELGKQQARKLKQRFINENIAPTHIYSSPLKRVKETAEIIADGTNIAIQYSDDLQEYLRKNGLVKVLKFPGVIAHQGSLLSKTDDGWKDNLKRIKQNSGKGNTIKV